MIEYDSKTKSIKLTEYLNWELHVKPIYEEVICFMDGDCDTAPVPADELTDAQINEIMETIVESYEHADWSMACMGDASPDLFGCAHYVIEEWCNEHFND